MSTPSGYIFSKYIPEHRPLPTKPLIIVHLMRHAEAQHKRRPQTNYTLHDPDLTPNGESQGWKFSEEFHPQISHIDHVLASPMFRTLGTAQAAFWESKMNGRDIIALPELQNVDRMPNGTGKDLSKLQKRWEERYQRGQTRIDVWTFMINDWNKKAPGEAGAKDFKERIGFLKGFLKGLWLGGQRRSIEAAVVTHSSFVYQLHLKTPSRAEEAQVTTCVFDERGDFKFIDPAELERLREDVRLQEEEMDQRLNEEIIEGVVGQLELENVPEEEWIPKILESLGKGPENHFGALEKLLKEQKLAWER